MKKEKLSNLFDDPTVEETEILVTDNIKTEEFESRKGIITKKVLKQIPSVKRVFVVSKKGVFAAAATIIALFVISLTIILVMDRDPSNGTIINNPTPTPSITNHITTTPSVIPTATAPSTTKTPAPTKTSTPAPGTPTATAEPTSEPTSTPKLTPSPTPIQPREGIEKDWPDDNWAPASATVFLADYPPEYSYFDNRFMFELQNIVSQKTVLALEKFSYGTAYELLKQGGNVNYSPLSLYFALSLCAQGAEGETFEELMNVLGLNNMSKEFLMDETRKLYNRLYIDHEFGKLKIANSVWLSNLNGVTYKQTFIDNARQHFYATLFSVDFTDEDTSKLMKKWIFDNTEGTLAPDFPHDPTTIFKIINTIYYRNQWNEEFEEENNYLDKFYGCTETTDMEFMKRTDVQAEYYKGEDYACTTLRVKGGKMVFLLPDEGVSIEDFLTSPGKLEAAIKSPTIYAPLFDGYMVTLHLPKFGFESKLDLLDMVKNLGLNDAFTDVADFSAITDIDLFLTDIKQDTYIQVDEKGITASAVTNISGGMGSPEWMEVEVNLNRPFIYCIMHEEKMPIFLGVFAN